MLKEEIQNTITRAMKEGNELVYSTLRMILAAVVSKEKEKRYKISKQKPDLNEKGLIKESQLTDEEIIDVITSEIKKRKNSDAAYEIGKREDLVKKEKAEIEILQKYLPEQLSEDEIREIIKEAIEKTAAKEIKDMGKVMGAITPQLKGKADMGLVSKIVRESL